VIVTVSGGVADLIFKSRCVAVDLYDYDVEGSGDKDPGISKDPDGQTCCIRQWGPSEEIAGSEHWPIIRKALKGGYCRTWKCRRCGKMADCSYEELAEAGSPICPDCDIEMEMLA
jgi:hypothetical protein